MCSAVHTCGHGRNVRVVAIGRLDNGGRGQLLRGTEERTRAVQSR